MKNLYLKSVRCIIFLTLLCLHCMLFAQKGPGGIGATDGTSHLKLWLRADKGVFSDAGITPATNGQKVQQWNDQSGNHLDAMRATLNEGPVLTTAGLNNQPTLGFSNYSFMNAAFDISPSVNPNVTIITVSSYALTEGQAPFSKLWGNDNGGYDRSIGFDVRAASGFSYFSGEGAEDFAFPTGYPGVDKAFISTARYTATNFSGYLQGFSSVNSAVSNNDGRPLLTIGAINSDGVEPWLGNIVEMIVYDTVLSLSQQSNIENYLSAKYGTTPLGNDFYRMDEVVNGNFDYDVVGLNHYTSEADFVTTARGTGLVTLGNASSLLLGNSYFIGHDNGSISPVTTDLPAGISTRLSRIWAGTEVNGDIGTMDISFDLPELAATDPANLRLLVDRTHNNIFADEQTGSGVISGFTKSGNTYTINVNMGDAERFTIGSVSAITLPVSLRSITVEQQGAYNKVQWKTEKETGFAYFEVQRSADGFNFFTLGSVQATTDMNALKDYFFVDNQPLPASFYRLKFVDHNGQFSYSPIVKLIKSIKRFTVSPNPATSIVTISGLDGSSTLIELLDINGKTLEQKTTGNLQYSLYLTKYAKGTYYIRIKTGKDIITQSILKQ